MLNMKQLIMAHNRRIVKNKRWFEYEWELNRLELIRWELTRDGIDRIVNDWVGIDFGWNYSGLN